MVMVEAMIDFRSEKAPSMLPEHTLCGSHLITPWLLMAALFLLIGSACSFDPGHEAVLCEVDLDCASDRSCLEGYCIATEDDGENDVEGGFNIEECASNEIRCGGECVNPFTDAAHCGGCDLQCGDDETCQQAACAEAPTCSEDETACSDQCIDTDSDDAHCGGCNQDCGDSASCEQGLCIPDSPPEPDECGDDERVCNNQCVDTDNDDAHCGGCDQSCGDDAACEQGLCVPDSPPDPSECGEHERICANLCVDTTSDDDHCGSCGNPCDDDASCEESLCVTSSPPGPDECDDDESICSNACVDLRSNNAHCGSCGNGCANDQFCEAGSCVDSPDPEPDPDQCEDNESVCGDSCVDTDVDDEHCGSCGNSCSMDQSCDAGACVDLCGAGEMMCSNACIDVSSDEDHCGSCGNSCGDNQQCESGQCVSEPMDCDPNPPANEGPFGGGDGSEQDPYRICSAQQLRSVDDTGAFRSSHFMLADNIDLGGESFEPLAQGSGFWENLSGGFEGSFDGHGFEIRDLTISAASDNRVGLFGFVEGAKLSNIVIRDADISGDDFVGGLVGLIRGNTSIENVTVTGDINGTEEVGGVAGYSHSSISIENSQFSGSVSGSSEVGGLVGRNDGVITNSSADANVQGSHRRIGGLVGDNNRNGSCAIMDSHATGDVSASSATAIGGLVGRHHVGCSITDSSASGDVDATGDSETIGGLVGWLRPNGTIVNSHATGDVTATDADYVGGLAGRVSSILGEDWSENEAPVQNAYAEGAVSGANSVGGLVGRSEGTIDGAHAIGDVEGTDSVGGLVGHIRMTDFGTAGAVADSYATGDVDGELWVGGLVGLQAGSIVGAHATGTVRGLSEVGGLVGRNADTSFFDTATITESYATGTVEGLGQRVGGLIGEHRGDLSRSFATGDVDASGAQIVGGAVGRVERRAQVVDCYATGSVTGSNHVGGFTGGVSSSGGVIGTGEVYRSYSTGEVSGNSSVGGFVGTNDGTVADAYWNTESSGVSNSDGGEGLNDQEFGTQGSFSGFDFSNIWEMDTHRPVLQWEGN